jgi:hypothetical protein
MNVSTRTVGTSVSAFSRAQWRSPRKVFLLWAIWLTFPYIFLGPYSYCRCHDNADSFLSVLHIGTAKATSALGQWWNSLIVGGQDALSSFQVPELVRWLFIPLPGWLAYGLLMFGQRFLAGFFLYRLLRDELDLVPWAAVYGGLTYALFTQRAIDEAWQGYNLCDGLSLPGIPATIWALSRIEPWRKPARWVAAAGVGVLVGLGQIFPFAIFYFAAYLVWFAGIKPRKNVKFWTLFAFFVAGWLAIVVVPVWASILNARLSQRSHWNLATDPMRSQAVYLTMAANLVRDNLLPLGLVVLGLCSDRLRDRRLSVLAVVIGGILAYVSGYRFFEKTILVRLGFLSGFHVYRVTHDFPFFSAVAAAVALPLILRGGVIQLGWRDRTITSCPMAVPIGLLAILLTIERSVETQVQVLSDMLSGENYSAFYRNSQILALDREYREAPPFRVATVTQVGCTIHPGMLWAYGLATADGYLQIYPERYHRFWGKVIERFLESAPNVRDYFQNWGCRVYLFGPGPGETEVEPTRIGDLCNLNLLSLANVRFLISAVPLKGDGLTLVSSGQASVSDARGSAASGGGSADETRRFARLRRFLTEGHRPIRLFIYENHQVIPRFFLAHRTRLFDDREQLLSAMADASHNELASTAFLLRDEANGIDLGQPVDLNSQVRVESMKAEEIIASIKVSRTAIFIMTQNYSPYWKVSVDGVEDHVIPVDHTFQGVKLGPGQHKVVLSYQPPYALY